MAAPDAFPTAAYQWTEGERLLREAPPERRRVLERVVESVVAELRRRLGGRFRSDELVALYDQGTTWVTDVATRVAPNDPDAWDPRIAADAAFARYLREASDYAGGQRVLEDA
jgi:predicted 2-oxoglutarate/Fe(II)-dependent dioxygenase YbiX